MLSMIKQWLNRPKPLPVELDRTLVGSEIADCKRCGELLKVRYTLMFMSHLRHDHGLEENKAISTAIEISESVYKRRRQNVS